MMRGVGIDMTSIAEVRRLVGQQIEGSAFVRHTFTVDERADALSKSDPYEHLAACFAAKEAFFKAFSPMLFPSSFDLRKVEMREREDGSPYFSEPSLRRVTPKDDALPHCCLSVTHEEGLACAFVTVDWGKTEE